MMNHRLNLNQGIKDSEYDFTISFIKKKYVPSESSSDEEEIQIYQNRKMRISLSKMERELKRIEKISEREEKPRKLYLSPQSYRPKKKKLIVHTKVFEGSPKKEEIPKLFITTLKPRLNYNCEHGEKQHPHYSRTASSARTIKRNFLLTSRKYINPYQSPTLNDVSFNDFETSYS